MRWGADNGSACRIARHQEHLYSFNYVKTEHQHVSTNFQNYSLTLRDGRIENFCFLCEVKQLSPIVITVVPLSLGHYSRTRQICLGFIGLGRGMSSNEFPSNFNLDYLLHILCIIYNFQILANQHTFPLTNIPVESWYNAFSAGWMLTITLLLLITILWNVLCVHCTGDCYCSPLHRIHPHPPVWWPVHILSVCQWTQDSQLDHGPLCLRWGKPLSLRHLGVFVNDVRLLRIRAVSVYAFIACD